MKKTWANGGVTLLPLLIPLFTMNTIGKIFASNSLDTETKFYTTKEVAEILKLTEYTVRKKIRNGDLKAEIFQGHSGYRICHEVLKDYISRHHNLITLEKFISSAPENFSNMIGKFEEQLRQNPSVSLNVNELKTLIEGKKIDLEGLQLQLRLLELDKDDTVEFQRKKISLEISINQLKAEIKALELVKSYSENERICRI